MWQKFKKWIQVPRPEKSSVKPKRNLTAALKIHILAANVFMMLPAHVTEHTRPDSHEPCSCSLYPWKTFLHVYWMYHSKYIIKGRLWPLFLPTPTCSLSSLFFFSNLKKVCRQSGLSTILKSHQNIASSPCLHLQAWLLHGHISHQGTSHPQIKSNLSIYCSSSRKQWSGRKTVQSSSTVEF